MLIHTIKFIVIAPGGADGLQFLEVPGRREPNGPVRAIVPDTFQLGFRLALRIDIHRYGPNQL